MSDRNATLLLICPIVPLFSHRLSCDKAVLGQLRQRTLGNSAARLHSTLVEQHTTEWMSRAMLYLSVLRKLRVPGVAQQQPSLPPMTPVPRAPWLIAVYVREAVTRLEETKARVTSIFGDVLKLDSTKKASVAYVATSVKNCALLITLP